ncbi:hypothetical protein ACJX0J_031159, partial [Zea mays]
ATEDWLGKNCEDIIDEKKYETKFVRQQVTHTLATVDECVGGQHELGGSVRQARKAQGMRDLQHFQDEGVQMLPVWFGEVLIIL